MAAGSRARRLRRHRSVLRAPGCRLRRNKRRDWGLSGFFPKVAKNRWGGPDGKSAVRGNKCRRGAVARWKAGVRDAGPQLSQSCGIISIIERRRDRPPTWRTKQGSVLALRASPALKPRDRSLLASAAWRGTEAVVASQLIGQPAAHRVLVGRRAKGPGIVNVHLHTLGRTRHHEACV
jgi:hypothetical protein